MQGNAADRNNVAAAAAAAANSAKAVQQVYERFETACDDLDSGLFNLTQRHCYCCMLFFVGAGGSLRRIVGGRVTSPRSPLSHSPAHMGTKKKKPFSGHLTDSYSRPHSKRQKQFVEAGLCRECGSPLGRAVTVCDKCADQVCAVEAAAAAARKSAAQKEAEKNSPLLSARELKALPALATGKDKVKECIERWRRCPRQRPQVGTLVCTLHPPCTPRPYPALLRRVRV